MNTNCADAPDFIGISGHPDKADLPESLPTNIGNPAACSCSSAPSTAAEIATPASLRRRRSAHSLAVWSLLPLTLQRQRPRRR